MVNKSRIFPISRLVGVEVNIDEVKSIADFKVIDIVDDSNIFPTFLGIYWAFEIQVIMNLKIRQMVFELGDLRVTTTLDPMEGEWYMEPVRDRFITMELDHIYNILVHKEDYINPTIDG